MKDIVTLHCVLVAVGLLCKHGSVKSWASPTDQHFFGQVVLNIVLCRKELVELVRL